MTDLPGLDIFIETSEKPFLFHEWNKYEISVSTSRLQGQNKTVPSTLLKNFRWLQQDSNSWHVRYISWHQPYIFELTRCSQLTFSSSKWGQHPFHQGLMRNRHYWPYTLREINILLVFKWTQLKSTFLTFARCVEKIFCSFLSENNILSVTS